MRPAPLPNNFKGTGWTQWFGNVYRSVEGFEHICDFNCDAKTWRKIFACSRVPSQAVQAEL